ncbi:MAG: prepilin-type N-terminal cleavage/methylation domain-containing protein [Patescibacteria group bacterium]
MNIISKSARGFTLIELLVVIAIIGILSSIVLASLNDARLKSRDAKRVADVKQIQLALELYYDATGSYPTTTLSVLAPTYISALPVDPVGGAAYPYDAVSATDYHLGANLEQSTHSALSADVDAADSGNVDGADDADGCAAEAGRTCYDVKP